MDEKRTGEGRMVKKGRGWRKRRRDHLKREEGKKRGKC